MVLMNAPWWRLAGEIRQTTTESSSTRVESAEDAVDLLPPFYD